MKKKSPLNDTEHFVLLALMRLPQDAYAIPIRREIEERAGRDISITAVYAALDRLERAGYVQSWMSEPVPERGGRARKHFRASREGVAAVMRERGALERMWEGLEAVRAVRKP